MAGMLSGHCFVKDNRPLRTVILLRYRRTIATVVKDFVFRNGEVQ